jgi:hypothetical protein
MSTIFKLLPCLVLFTACNSQEKENNNTLASDTVKTKINETREKALHNYDTLFTDIARYIAGLSTEKYFTNLQQKPFYTEHKQFTDTSWLKTKKNMLDPVGIWCTDKKITDATDSSLCFYPLSGPDFLFGNTFFPHAKNYVLLGLEPNGLWCDFRELNEKQNESYLAGIRKSMAYLNKAGYFVTSHMSGDFTRSHLNGMVHMMLYMMARTGHTITSVNRIKVDSAGNAHIITPDEKTEEPNLAGVRIEFLSPDRKIKKSAYYFRVNVRDKEIARITGFLPFIESFGKRVSYMKSASCVLTNTDFATIRNLVLGSDKVLQDDTGVPYKYFSANEFDIRLFGQYTMTIKDLDWCMQNDLKKAVDTSADKGPLPFRISYIGNYGEGMLLFAKRKK